MSRRDVLLKYGIKKGAALLHLHADRGEEWFKKNHPEVWREFIL